MRGALGNWFLRRFEAVLWHTYELNSNHSANNRILHRYNLASVFDRTSLVS